MNRSQYNRYIRELRADNSKIRKQIYDMKRFNRKTDYYIKNNITFIESKKRIYDNIRLSHEDIQEKREKVKKEERIQEYKEYSQGVDNLMEELSMIREKIAAVRQNIGRMYVENLIT